jgi:hypothetical protein
LKTRSPFTGASLCDDESVAYEECARISLVPGKSCRFNRSMQHHVS